MYLESGTDWRVRKQKKESKCCHVTYSPSFSPPPSQVWPVQMVLWWNCCDYAFLTYFTYIILLHF